MFWLISAFSEPPRPERRGILKEIIYCIRYIYPSNPLKRIPFIPTLKYGVFWYAKQGNAKSSAHIKFTPSWPAEVQDVGDIIRGEGKLNQEEQA
jgi:hypothetical protein